MHYELACHFNNYSLCSATGMKYNRANLVKKVGITMTPFAQDHFPTFKENHKNTGRLMIKCPDQPGIVAAVSSFLQEYEANIVELSQYSMDPNGGTFFTRIEFDCPELENKAKGMSRSL